ncbi:MAG: hypothetical protein FJ189_14190 [Gammaproteobacteria bacterium]|nr:hypothetical protein [Gammaproteobacteria bacterium]
MKRNYHVIGLACLAALASSASWAGPDQRLVQPGTDITMATREPLRATTTMTPQTAGTSSGEYARLSARWWQWALSGPDGRNAIQDETGKFCGLNQPKGYVWFLAGTLGKTGVERHCTIPANRKIFYPLVNVSWTDCPGSADEQYSDQEVRDMVAQYTGGGDLACKLSSTLDGTPVTALSNAMVRTQSPKFYSYLPKNNIIKGCYEDPARPLPPGKTGRQISEGYWLMLPKLSPGKHTLTLHGAGCNPAEDNKPFFETAVTYHLNVLPPAER